MTLPFLTSYFLSDGGDGDDSASLVYQLYNVNKTIRVFTERLGITDWRTTEKATNGLREMACINRGRVDVIGYVLAMQKVVVLLRFM